MLAKKTIARRYIPVKRTVKSFRENRTIGQFTRTVVPFCNRYFGHCLTRDKALSDSSGRRKSCRTWSYPLPSVRSPDAIAAAASNVPPIYRYPARPAHYKEERSVEGLPVFSIQPYVRNWAREKYPHRDTSSPIL